MIKNTQTRCSWSDGYFLPTNTNVTSITGGVITFSNSFYVMGSFDVTLQFHSACYVDALEYSKVATMGDMFHIVNCVGNSIENLELDGNIDNTLIGGGFHDGIQAAYDGIFQNGSYSILLSDLYIHHFGHDGIYVIYRKCPGQLDPPVGYQTCLINNCQVEFNSRTNLAWGGGRHLNAFRSSFNFAALNRLASSTYSGVDIEYENSDLDNSSGTFDQCKFLSNQASGLICDAAGGPNPSTNKSFDYSFIDCNFAAGENGYAVWPNTAHMWFADCKFYGAVVNPYSSIVSFNDAISNTDYIQFDRCDFDEDYFDPLTRRKYSISYQQPDETYLSYLGSYLPINPCPYQIHATHHYLIDFSHATRVRFKSCNVYSNFTMNAIQLLVPPGTNVENYNWIQSTNFYNYGINECSCDRVPFALSGIIIDEDLATATTIQERLTGRNYPVPPDPNACLPNANLFWHIGTLFSDPSPNPITQGHLGHFWPWQGWNVPLRPLLPKYHDPIDPNLVELYHTPCISAPPTYPTSCLVQPRIKNGKTESELKEVFTVTPIPATNSIEISSSNIGELIRIIDTYGKIVHIQVIEQGKLTIDISNYLPGFYIISPSISKAKTFIKL